MNAGSPGTGKVGCGASRRAFGRSGPGAPTRAGAIPVPRGPCLGPRDARLAGARPETSKESRGPRDESRAAARGARREAQGAGRAAVGAEEAGQGGEGRGAGGADSRGGGRRRQARSPPVDGFLPPGRAGASRGEARPSPATLSRQKFRGTNRRRACPCFLNLPIRLDLRLWPDQRSHSQSAR